MSQHGFEHGSAVPVAGFDYPADPAGDLAEACGLEYEVAAQVLEYQAGCRRDPEAQGAELLGKLISKVLGTLDGPLNLRLLGLKAYSFATLLNRTSRSLTAAADRVGVHKAVLSYHQRRAAEALDGFTGVHQKSKAARDKLSASWLSKWKNMPAEEREKRRSRKKGAE